MADPLPHPGATAPRLLPRRHARAGALVLLALAATAAPALTRSPLAQDRLPIDPLEGRYRRELREIERQAVTDPSAAARQAAQTRRRLVNDSGGVVFTPER